MHRESILVLRRIRTQCAHTYMHRVNKTYRIRIQINRRVQTPSIKKQKCVKRQMEKSALTDTKRLHINEIKFGVETRCVSSSSLASHHRWLNEFDESLFFVLCTVNGYFREAKINAFTSFKTTNDQFCTNRTFPV